MKLKSYLRGLGLGMIVTTIILVIAFNNRNDSMTDAEIVSRAYELGMVETSLYGNGDEVSTESTKQADNTIETSGEGQVDPENNPEGTSVATEAATVSGSSATTEAESTTNESTTPESTTQETTTQETTTQETTTAKPVETTKATEAETTTAASNQYITIVFENINTATKASTLLYEAGIIQDIQEFNNYLTERGLATKVGEGTFRFRKGMTFEEITKIITHQN